jgi:hypothetical protein
MTLDEACGLLGERFKTERPRRSELSIASREYLAHGRNITAESVTRARWAVNAIWDHWYGRYDFRTVGDRFWCIDPAGSYGTAELTDEDCSWSALQDLQTAPKPLPVLPPDFDWRAACLKILKAVGEAEGVWFESGWGMTPEQIVAIRYEYDRWEREGAG